MSPATVVRRNVINFRDPWNFYEVYTNLPDFARSYPFDPYDLSTSVTRMATLAPHGRITTDVVDDQVRRLCDDGAFDAIIEELLGGDAASRLDRYDAAQLAIVLRTCRERATASGAGRVLFANSRLERKSSNDAGRLVKCLARFGLKFEDTRKRI